MIRRGVLWPASAPFDMRGDPGKQLGPVVGVFGPACQHQAYLLNALQCLRTHMASQIGGMLPHRKL